MVKAVKGEPFNGYFERRTASKVRRIDQSNVHEFKADVPRFIASSIAKHSARRQP
jgi:hypothetical protein